MKWNGSYFSQSIFLRYPDQIKAAAQGSLSVQLNSIEQALMERYQNETLNQQKALEIQTLLNKLYNDNNWEGYSEKVTKGFLQVMNKLASDYTQRGSKSLSVKSLRGSSMYQAGKIWEDSGGSVKGVGIKNSNLYTQDFYNSITNLTDAKNLQNKAHSYFGKVANYNGEILEKVLSYLFKAARYEIDSLIDDSSKELLSSFGKTVLSAPNSGFMTNSQKTLGNKTREVRLDIGTKGDVGIYSSKQKADLKANFKFSDNEFKDIGISGKSMSSWRTEINLTKGMNVFGALINVGGVDTRYLYSILTVYDDWANVVGDMTINLNAINKIVLIEAMRGVTATETQADLLVLWTGTGSKQPFRVISTSSFLSAQNINETVKYARFEYDPATPPIGANTPHGPHGRTDKSYIQLTNWRVNVYLSSEAYKLAMLKNNWGIS